MSLLWRPTDRLPTSRWIRSCFGVSYGWFLKNVRTTLLVEATDGRQTQAATETGELLASQCQAAVLLAMQIPHLRLGFAVAPGTWKDHLESIPDSFTKAALCENRLNVQAWSPEQVVERLRTQIGINFVDP